MYKDSLAFKTCSCLDLMRLSLMTQRVRLKSRIKVTGILSAGLNKPDNLQVSDVAV